MSFAYICKVSLFGSLCTAMFLTSCMDHEKEEASKRVIEIGKAISSPAELKASDYFDEIRYIPLETKDDCLIGSSPDIKLLDEYILVTTDNRQCFLFDKATGRFKCQVGHVGNDPGGYRSVDCLVDELNGRLLFNGWGHDLISYDLSGNYVGKIEVPCVQEEAYPSNCFVMNRDTIVGFFQNTLGKEENRVLYFQEEGGLLALLPNESQCDPFEINSMSVWKGESAVKEFGPSALRGLIYIEGKDPETASVMYPNNSNFWHVGKDTYFMESFNDTIFQMKDTTLIPYLWFDCADLKWDYKDRFSVDKSRGLFIPQILDSKRSLFALAITGLYDKDKRKTYCVAFDKQKGETRASLFENGIKDDITGFLPIRLTAVSSSGEYGGILSMEDITKWMDKHTGRELPKELATLKDIDEEQNPVVVLLR
ncbi:DUF4934 domain-containing protein [uncultured Parabacteroides sp.]|uniref:DUF4934 domain-containing protein n=1 Tax=uncultured Parabacteroides sp. TaxID=512312 RepID=UPI0026078B05|nr:DUF4934 domain-containing protein [uncultured Parabacteroides sp.]